MREKRKVLALILILILLFTGCSKDEESNEESNTSVVDTSEMFTERDYESDYDESKSVLIELKGDFVSCDSDTVKISGTTVTITDEGTYIVSGTLNDGMIIVNAGENDKPQIVLNGASITSETCAAMYILEADKVFVTLADGTSNILSNGGNFTAIDDNNIDGAIFSKQDLTLNGSGSLEVTSPAAHGIVCKDDLVFTGGTYTVNSASHGLDANDSVRVTNASIEIDAGKDGIHVENTDDTTLGFIYIADGTFDIISGGGSSNATKQTSDSWGGFMGGRGNGMDGARPGQRRNDTQLETQSVVTESDDNSTSIKAIKASGKLLIDDGTFTIDTADDAVHSNSSITVNGGTFYVASGDDGFHADETLTITSGTIEVTESYEGLEALNIKISGGDVKLVSSDDGLNAAGGMDSSGTGGVRGKDQFGGRGMSSSSNGSIHISGGNLYINASGDGIDANGTLEISGGNTIVVGPTQGDTATLDYDTSAVITGGIFIGTGASGMAQTFSDSDQGVLAVNVGNQAAGTVITLQDKHGNTIISHEPELSFGVVILSSPDMEKGETYSIMVGEASGEFEAS